MGVYRTVRRPVWTAFLRTGLDCACPLVATSSAASGGPIITTVKVPKTGGLPVTKVSVVRWLKKEGDAVKRGDAVVELETEKVNYELDSPADGVLLKILTQEGSEVPVGEAVCQIGESGEQIPK